MFRKLSPHLAILIGINLLSLGAASLAASINVSMMLITWTDDARQHARYQGLRAFVSRTGGDAQEARMLLASRNTPRAFPREMLPLIELEDVAIERRVLIHAELGSSTPARRIDAASGTYYYLEATDTFVKRARPRL